MNPTKIMDLVQQHGDISLELGIAFAQEKSEQVEIYAHRRAELFEKIQEAICSLEINNVKLD